GHLIKILQNAQAGYQTHSFTVDDIGRKLTETHPESGTTTYTYDSSGGAGANCGARSSVGDLLDITYANGAINCFDYDPLHRLTDVGNSVGNTTNFCKRFRYDNVGNALHPAPSGFPSAPNAAARIIEAQSDNCANFTAITDEWFAYDKDGRVTDVWLSTPNSGGYYH